MPTDKERVHGLKESWDRSIIVLREYNEAKRKDMRALGKQASRAELEIHKMLGNGLEQAVKAVDDISDFIEITEENIEEILEGEVE